MDWGHFLFGFSGRINRAKYWLWLLLYMIAAFILGIIMYAVNSAVIGGIIQFVFGVAVFISSLAVMTKRLHDRNKSAVWLLIFVLAPSVLLGIGVGVMIYGAASGSGGNMGGMGVVGGAFVLAAVGILIWVFVELGCLRGTVGSNQYGPDPLGGALAPAR